MNFDREKYRHSCFLQKLVVNLFEGLWRGFLFLYSGRNMTCEFELVKPLVKA